MRKKILIDQLQPGMFIHDLGADWLSHPFLRHRFAVKTDADVVKIRESGIRELYIDVERGDDVTDAPTEREVQAAVEAEIREVAKDKPDIQAPVSSSEEMGRAKFIHRDAIDIVRGVMHDVRLGAQANVRALEPVVERMTHSILRNSSALLSLCMLKDADTYTFQHSVSVSALMITFCRSLDMKPEQIREAGLGAMLHDVGKMKTPLDVLNKPGRLTDEEFAIMRRHPVDGYELLVAQGGLSETALHITRQHHERMDGSGYPDKLPGDQIDFYARMAAIVDVYDAISSERCYHKGMPPSEALRKLFEWSKFHFDMDLVKRFVHCIGIYPAGSLVMLESGRLAVVTEQNEAQLLKPKVRVIYDTRRMEYVRPLELDLSRGGLRHSDAIVSFESPERWKIDLSVFL
jgi:putative nucleotidyltransferase with HDIG domain